MNNRQDYANMSKDELIRSCMDKDIIIEGCLDSIKKSDVKLLNKSDIMELFNCESNKALKILRLMFQMGYGNKIGKEYYVLQKSQRDFLECMVGKEVFI